MTRRTLLRKPLVAALALLVAAAPSLATAGGVYGTKRTCPLQFKNWSGAKLYKVSLTHNYGVYTDKYDFGTLNPGDVKQGGNVTYYTGGTFSAGDFWSIAAEYYDDNGTGYFVWRALDEYDLKAIDAGVPFTVIISRGALSNQTGTNMKLSFYSNNGSWTDLPLFRFYGGY